MNAANRRRRLLALCAGSLALTSACGLTPGAVGALQHTAQLGYGATAGNGLAGTGSGSAAVGSSGSLPGAAGSSGSVGAAGAASGASAGAAGAAAAASSAPAGGTLATTPGGASWETTGITASTIYIGLHAPQTGAAPVPLQAFATGAKLFWESHKVFGRQVVVQFMDDQYNASRARQVCEQLSRQTFLVVGGAGTDQIQACATDPFLAQSHTPYLSAGVTTNGLTGLFNYFAITQTYAAQAPEVWTMASQLYRSNAAGKWAIVTENTPNFNDVTSAMAAVLGQHHIAYKVIRTAKVFQQSDADTAVSEAEAFTGRTGGTVFLDVDPNFWIDMVNSSARSLYQPAWVGPGLTNGENLVAEPVCGEQANIEAAFLSPFPALDHQPSGFSNESNPAPDAAPNERDIEMDIYGTNEAIYYMLESLGSIQNLTRDNFIKAMASFSAASSYSAPGGPLHVLPSVAYRGGHFGGTAMWIEKLACTNSGGPAYVTVGNAPIAG